MGLGEVVMKIRIRLKDHGAGSHIPGLVWHDGDGRLLEAVVEVLDSEGKYWEPVEVVYEEES